MNIPKPLQIDSLKKAYILSGFTITVALSVYGIIGKDYPGEGVREAIKIEQLD